MVNHKRVELILLHLNIKILLAFFSRFEIIPIIHLIVLNPSVRKNMYSKPAGDLSKIYQLNEDIAESRARIAAMRYNAWKNGLTSEKERSCRIENMRVRMNELTIKRRNELMTSYSHMVLKQKVLTLRPLSQPSVEATTKPRSRSASLLSQSVESLRTLSSRSHSELF